MKESRRLELELEAAKKEIRDLKKLLDEVAVQTIVEEAGHAHPKKARKRK